MTQTNELDIFLVVLMQTLVLATIHKHTALIMSALSSVYAATLLSRMRGPPLPSDQDTLFALSIGLSGTVYCLLT